MSKTYYNRILLCCGYILVAFLSLLMVYLCKYSAYLFVLLLKCLKYFMSLMFFYYFCEYTHSVVILQTFILSVIFLLKFAEFPRIEHNEQCCTASLLRACSPPPRSCCLFFSAGNTVCHRFVVLQFKF